MIVGKYVLHLYCDDPRHECYKHNGCPGEFTGENMTGAMREAKEAGWIVTGRPPRVLCPVHAKTEKA